MVIETKMVFAQYLKLMFLLSYRKPMVIYITIIGTLLLIGSLLYAVGFKIYESPPYFQFIFGLFTVVVIPFSIYRNAKNTFASHGRLHENITYEFTDNLIKITGESFTVEESWEKTYRILELNSWMLIYQNKHVANVIPKEAFGDQLTMFRKLVKGKPFIKQKLRN